MPYVITTVREALAPALSHGLPVVASRRAVATREDAREACIQAAPEGMKASHAIHVALKIANLSESGGTVGPLPDGTVIEVERVTWADLSESVKWLGRGFVREEEWPEVIATFNAREARP